MHTTHLHDRTPSRRAAAALAASTLLLAAGCSENLTPIPERAAYEPADLEPLECVPNLDGQITAEELREALGVPVSYLVNPAGTTPRVDLGGQVDGDGNRRWDLSTGAEDDQLARLSASSLEGKWYASSFPTGQFVVAGDLAGRIENIYRRDDEGFYLLGVASATEDPPEGKTLLVYDSPIALYRFPLKAGKSWISRATTSNATVRGLPYAGQDTYETKVEATGELFLPDFTFEQVHLVRTKVTVAPATGEAIVQQQVSFLFECFGEVARVTGPTGQEDPFFEEAAQLRRIGVQQLDGPVAGNQ